MKTMPAAVAAAFEPKLRDYRGGYGTVSWVIFFLVVAFFRFVLFLFLFFFLGEDCFLNTFSMRASAFFFFTLERVLLSYPLILLRA